MRLKNQMLLFIILITVFSCSNRSDQSGLTVQTDTNGRLNKQIDTNEIKINTRFPFGCADLSKYKYPVNWPGDLENYGQLKQPKGQEFEKIGSCFSDIHKKETMNKKPEILQVDHIPIGEDFKNRMYYDTIARQNIDSLKYRLPDIFNYECYYYFGQSKQMFGEYGTLLLLDPKLRRGKTLNIYYEIGGDQHINLRYFLFDEETIKIYEGTCYDDGCSLTEKYSVKIKSDGEIIISELKKPER